MSDIVVIKETEVNVATVAEAPGEIVVTEPSLSVVEVSAGPKGDKGDDGQDAVVLFGTGLPPDPTGLPDGALYIRYTV